MNIRPANISEINETRLSKNIQNYKVKFHGENDQVDLSEQTSDSIIKEVKEKEKKALSSGKSKKEYRESLVKKANTMACRIVSGPITFAYLCTVYRRKVEEMGREALRVSIDALKSLQVFNLQEGDKSLDLVVNKICEQGYPEYKNVDYKTFINKDDEIVTKVYDKQWKGLRKKPLFSIKNGIISERIIM